MPRVSPQKTNFNGGEFSELLQFRNEIDRYPSAMRSLYNTIASPQGPCLFRSGTYFQHDAYKHDKYSALVPFVFSDEQANILEFSDLVMRVLSEDGILVYSNDAVTNVLATTPMQFTSAVLTATGGAVGKQVALSGFPAASNVNGRIANITAKSGNNYTVDVNYSGATGVPAGAPTAALVFALTTTYAHTDVRNIRAVQSIDIVYLFCKGYAPRKLQRMVGPTSWVIAPVAFIDGPYISEPANPPLLTPSATGKAIEIHTADIGVNGTASSSGTNTAAWMAFDASLDTYWEGNSNQVGILEYAFGVAKIIVGYVVYTPRRNDGSTFGSKDYRPITWTFEASSNNVDWITLDEKYDYALWQNYRTQYIPINNSIAYRYYRINIKSLETKGTQNARVAGLSMREQTPPTLTLTAASTAEINFGAGFLSTDVGRLMRLYQNDGFWRPVKIIGRTSTTVITIELQDDPLLNTDVIRRWRMGAFSDTTGWPTAGAFFEDRLVMGGGITHPTLVGMSEPQNYEKFSPTDPNGAVVDDNGITFVPNTRSAAPARWFVEDEKGMLIGFGTSEWIIKVATANQPFSARNAKAVRSTERGSAAVEPVVIDKQVVFVQKSKRTMREFAYVYETDGFRAPSMSLFASHLGVPKFAQLAYAAEPHSIIWCRREDGTVVGLTYNRDENIVGWHRHNFSDAVIESIAVIPGGEDFQDYLWMVCNRTVNGGTKRYIEKLMPFWDFGSTLGATAHFVDSGLSFVAGVATTVVYGLTHLEGKSVHGLIRGIHFAPQTVTNGSITLPFTANIGDNVVIGLAYECYGATVNFNDGAAEGTAQGKVGRMHNISVAVWDSLGGEVGVFNEDTLSDDFTEAFTDDQYRVDELSGTPQLFTGILGPILPEGHYGKRKAIVFRQRLPYPFNIAALLPQMDTQDRG